MTDLLTFPVDTPLRRRLQPPAARRHPGKLHLGFLAWLLDRYAPRGARLLDPFGGAGSLLLATLPPWGCQVLLNELEPQWVEQARATWAYMQSSPAQPAGAAAIVQGDARHLALCRPCDVLITSPPWADMITHKGPDNTRSLDRLHFAPSSVLNSHGFDAVVTSPPYADALSATNGHIGPGLPAARAQDRPNSADRLDGWHYDALITSPPYADALSHQRHTGDAAEREPQHGGGADSRIALRHGYGTPTPGRRDPAQIGNLAGARYWAAMAAVWAACVPLVRPGGLLIIVVKNIVRKNAEVDLIGGTRAQLEALGCTYVTTHYRAVAPGPFHRIRQKSRPDALIIDREGALVVEVPP